MIEDHLLYVRRGVIHFGVSPYTGDSKDKDGNIYQFNNGVYHHENKPAVEYANGTKIWMKHGRYHREDGPSHTWKDGSKSWFIHGERIFTWKRYHELSTLSPEQQVIIKLRYAEQLK